MRTTSPRRRAMVVFESPAAGDADGNWEIWDGRPRATASPGRAGTAGDRGNVTVAVANGASVSGGTGSGYGVYIEQASIAAISNAGSD